MAADRPSKTREHNTPAELREIKCECGKTFYLSRSIIKAYRLEKELLLYACHCGGKLDIQDWR